MLIVLYAQTLYLYNIYIPVLNLHVHVLYSKPNCRSSLAHYKSCNAKCLLNAAITSYNWYNGCVCVFICTIKCKIGYGVLCGIKVVSVQVGRLSC